MNDSVVVRESELMSEWMILSGGWMIHLECVCKGGKCENE